MKHRLIPSAAVLVLASLGYLASPEAAQGQEAVFLRGDFNADGRVSLSDVLMLRRFLFLGEWPPTCLDTGDADDNGVIDLTDAIGIVVQLFPLVTNPSLPWGTPRIAEPFPEPGVDPTDGGTTCASYTVAPAAESADRIRLGTIEAVPGETVEVPVFLTNSVDIEAVQLVVEYDPEQFTPQVKMNFDGTYFESILPETEWFLAVDAHPDDRVFTVGIVGDFIYDQGSITPGTETLIAKIVGKVAGDVPAGTVIDLTPTNGPDGEGVKPPLLMRNELTHEGGARLASILPETIAGAIGIVDDITFFVRGDANSDGHLNISDPISILGFLFLGSVEIACLDAADADDSGEHEVTDAIYLLDYLFSASGNPPPVPFPDAGGDPTPDDFRPCRAR